MYCNDTWLNRLCAAEGPFVYPVEDISTLILREDNGGLLVVDGRLVLADTYAINLGIALALDVSDGMYDTFLFTAEVGIHADKKTAALMVRFDDDLPERWEMCLPQDVGQDDLEAGGYVGVPTHSGNLSILAERTCQWLIEHPEDAGTVLQAIEEDIALTYFENGGVSNVRLPGIQANIVTVVAGTELLAHPAYVGYREDKPVVLVVDLLLP